VTKYYAFNGQRVAMREGDVVYYLHGDHLGSTSVASSDSGALHSRQGYTPYGEVRYVTGELPTEFGFTGQRKDSYVELIQMGARWYSPKIGRWLSADSIIPDFVNPQSFNRYSYVYNNALKYVDPTGHIPWWIIAAGAAVLTVGGVGVGVLYDVATAPVIKDESLRPPHPSSPDMTNWLIDRLKENAQAPVTKEIRRHLQSAAPWDKVGAAKAWAALVGPEAVWDIKENINYAQEFVEGTWNIVLSEKDFHFDVVANLHFGFVGRAAGFSEEFLVAGAGMAQLKRAWDTKDLREVGELSLNCYGDHPYATWSVRFGSYLYDRFGDRLYELDQDEFAQALENYIKDNPIPDPPPFP
jgi:RHS repeat-associated protein